MQYYAPVKLSLDRVWNKNINVYIFLFFEKGYLFSQNMKKIHLMHMH